jgi:hypothetical protein
MPLTPKLLAAAVAALLWASPAMAGAEVDTGVTSGGASVGVSTGSGGGGSSHSGGSPFTGCRDALPLEAAVASAQQATPDLPSGLGPGQHWLVCDYAGANLGIAYVAGGGVADTMAAVAQAESQLHVDPPAVHTAPPRTGTLLVGVPVWFWTDAAAPVSATATVPGLSATVTATPGKMTIDFGEGEALTCAGGGTPWTPTEHASSDCSHTFQTAGRRTAALSVEWALTWTATNGRRGSLPTLRRTTSVDLTARDAQAVTD